MTEQDPIQKIAKDVRLLTNIMIIYFLLFLISFFFQLIRG